MLTQTFSSRTIWRVPGTCGEVADVLRYPLDLPRWWPSVYLTADELAPPDERGLHQRVAVQTKGWLPYTLRWELDVVESRYPERMVLEARGDLDGRGVWTFAQDGAFVIVTHDSEVRVARPIAPLLEPLAGPIFQANHRWAMAQGEDSLRLELLRRRATSVDARREVPPPPGPVTYAAVGILAGAAVVGGGLGYLVLRQRRKARRRRQAREARED